MYVPCWPAFVIWSWADSWDISKVNYNHYLTRMGLESLQYMISMHCEEEVEYHYMIGLAADSTYKTRGAASMFFEKFFLMVGVEIKDFIILCSAPVMFVIFWPFNIAYAVTQIVLEATWATSLSASLEYPAKLTMISTLVKWLGYDDIVADQIHSFINQCLQNLLSGESPSIDDVPYDNYSIDIDDDLIKAAKCRAKQRNIFNAAA